MDTLSASQVRISERLPSGCAESECEPHTMPATQSSNTQPSQKRKVIIDCDPGLDDILALTLALKSSDQLEILLISVVSENTDVYSCLRNVIKLMQVLKDESEHRVENGRKALEYRKVPIAVGAAEPLGSDREESTSALPAVSHAELQTHHGPGGLNDYHSRHPSARLTERLHLFRRDVLAREPEGSANFIPVLQPAHEEVINIINSDDEDEVTILALGPLTNIAMTLQNSEACRKVRKVICMGGALTVPGDVTSKAEFNIYLDPQAASIVFNATKASHLGQVRLTLVPLDITNKYRMTGKHFDEVIGPQWKQGSPLARSLTGVFGESMNQMHAQIATHGYICHDPLVIHSMLRNDLYTFLDDLDVRVATDGYDLEGEDSDEEVLDDGKRGRGQTYIDKLESESITGEQQSAPEKPGDYIRDKGEKYEQERNHVTVMQQFRQPQPGKPFAVMMLEAMFA